MVLHRVIWFMIFMSALGFFIYYAYSRISFYLLFTMNVSVEVNFLSRMPFPAVTFCNQNAFKYCLLLSSSSLVAYSLVHLVCRTSF